MNPLRLVISEDTRVEYNLAAEEVFLNESKTDILFLYINKDALVLGKHQNPWLEINVPFCLEHQIPIIRRLTGGGTVFHDLGNINFSFIRNKPEDFVNFSEHIHPIQKSLQSLGLDCSISPRNDLFIGDYKISGNAEHVSNVKKRIIHHGTILYGSKLDRLRGALKKQNWPIETHAVPSVSSPVTNIIEHKDLGATTEFMTLLVSKLQENLTISEIQDKFKPSELEDVELLVQSKYSQWDWNFGHSPQYKISLPENRTVTIRKGEIISSENFNEETHNQLIGLKIKEIKQSSLSADIKRHLLLPS
ncbi:lipoate--protein ligase family protein [bacterium]|nr:lipoate--protein ligase family protein [bacterium]